MRKIVSRTGKTNITGEIFRIRVRDITQDTFIVQMETISRHAVKYRTEKYFKNLTDKEFYLL